MASWAFGLLQTGETATVKSMMLSLSLISALPLRYINLGKLLTSESLLTQPKKGGRTATYLPGLLCRRDEQHIQKAENGV